VEKTPYHNDACGGALIFIDIHAIAFWLSLFAVFDLEIGDVAYSI